MLVQPLSGDGYGNGYGMKEAAWGKRNGKGGTGKRCCRGVWKQDDDGTKS